jgi:RHS repeat-associated protein
VLRQRLEAAPDATAFEGGNRSTDRCSARPPSGGPCGVWAGRRQISWQDATNSPTTTAAYAYNGGGERVEQQVTSGGTTTTTLYIGAYEEIAITGSQTTTTKYYQAGTLSAESVNGALYYLVGDNLGSVSVTLTSGGSVQATALYAPYGAVRYSQGTMPTSLGFTHQRLDGSGLNYFHARYYDSSLGQFASADGVQGPNRYAYTGGNPETRTDPTGQCWFLCAIVGAVVGAVVGAAVSYGSQVVNNVVNNGFSLNDFTQNINGGAILASAGAGALAGAIIGATDGLGTGVAISELTAEGGEAAATDFVGEAGEETFMQGAKQVLSTTVRTAIGLGVGNAILAGINGGNPLDIISAGVFGFACGFASGIIAAGACTIGADFGVKAVHAIGHFLGSPPDKKTNPPGSGTPVPSPAPGPSGNTSYGDRGFDLFGMREE